MLRRFFCKIVLVVVVACGLLALSGVLLAQGRSEDGLARAIEVQERHTERLLAINGVEGTAVGLDENDRPAVKVFTDGPGVAGIPRTLDGVPVRVVVTGKFYALAPGGKPGKPEKKPSPPEPSIDPTGWFDRPVPIGVSTGHPAVTAGTIGCRVKNGNSVYALSNNHVYANQNQANEGDAVIQPGTYDGGTSPADDIGTLADFEDILFPSNPDAPYTQWPLNIMDAAIALSDTSNLGKATPADGYGAPKSTTLQAALNQKVLKYGRTTGLTKGIVSELNAAVLVGYSSDQVALFVNQIVILPAKGRGFSDGGDSGSLIVTDPGRNPVGLLFAGGGRRTIANPIGPVLVRFGVLVDGE